MLAPSPRALQSFAACCLLIPTLFNNAVAQSPSLEVEAATEPSTAADIYGEGVRPTPWLSPAQQREGFHLPSGFEIRLFASEPQIAKPLNLAHDAKGRLWVTQSSRYPYPLTDASPADDSAADAVVILEDADGDGFAEQATTFADGLNIPIGILPAEIVNAWLTTPFEGGRHQERLDNFKSFERIKERLGGN